jgi:hypothetical protein
MITEETRKKGIYGAWFSHICGAEKYTFREVDL